MLPSFASARKKLELLIDALLLAIQGPVASTHWLVGQELAFSIPP